MRKKPLKKFDSRLVGTWRSDRHRTIKEWIFKPRKNTPKRRKFLNSLFGHLVLRYTRNHCHSSFKGSKESGEYEVIGMDSDSVAIMAWDSLLDEPKKQLISHIHFVDDHYWINIGRQREWFKKIKSKK